MKSESLANLKSRVAPDTPGLTSKNSQVVSVRLHIDDVAAIAELEGDRSYIIRQAVKNYLKNINHHYSSKKTMRYFLQAIETETNLPFEQEIQESQYPVLKQELKNQGYSDFELDKRWNDLDEMYQTLKEEGLYRETESN